MVRFLVVGLVVRVDFVEQGLEEPFAEIFRGIIKDSLNLFVCHIVFLFAKVVCKMMVCKGINNNQAFPGVINTYASIPRIQPLLMLSSKSSLESIAPSLPSS